jgi:hypothetical protein
VTKSCKIIGVPLRTVARSSRLFVLFHNSYAVTFTHGYIRIGEIMSTIKTGPTLRFEIATAHSNSEFASSYLIVFLTYSHISSVSSDVKSY